MFFRMVRVLFQSQDFKKQYTRSKTTRRADGSLEKDISDQSKIIEEHWLDDDKKK